MENLEDTFRAFSSRTFDASPTTPTSDQESWKTVYYCKHMEEEKSNIKKSLETITKSPPPNAKLGLNSQESYKNVPIKTSQSLLDRENGKTSATASTCFKSKLGCFDDIKDVLFNDLWDRKCMRTQYKEKFEEMVTTDQEGEQKMSRKERSTETSEWPTDESKRTPTETHFADKDVTFQHKTEESEDYEEILRRDHQQKMSRRELTNRPDQNKKPSDLLDQTSTENSEDYEESSQKSDNLKSKKSKKTKSTQENHAQTKIEEGFKRKTQKRHCKRIEHVDASPHVRTFLLWPEKIRFAATDKTLEKQHSKEETPVFARSTYSDWRSMKEQLIQEFEDVKKKVQTGAEDQKERARREMKDVSGTSTWPKAGARRSSKTQNDWNQWKEYLLEGSEEKCRKEEDKMARKLREIHEVVEDVKHLSEKFPLFEENSQAMEKEQITHYPLTKSQSKRTLSRGYSHPGTFEGDIDNPEITQGTIYNAGNNRDVTFVSQVKFQVNAPN